jgi:uncharacterized hydrophobic protein (TIGR00271 family)
MFNLIIFENLREQDKRAAIKNLIESSAPRQEFYVIIALATGIATLGLISNSIAVVIGSMMIAPMLFPLSALGMGFAVNSLSLIWRSVRTILIASLFGLLFSVILAFLFRGDVELFRAGILADIKPGIAFTMVAFLSGVAAAFSFAKPHLNISLSGVAIAVALVPPLGATGIGIAIGDFQLAFNSITQYTINLAMIILANFLIFKFMEFETRETTAEVAVDKTEKEVKEEIKVAEEKIEQKNNEKEN